MAIAVAEHHELSGLAVQSPTQGSLAMAVRLRIGEPRWPSISS